MSPIIVLGLLAALIVVLRKHARVSIMSTSEPSIPLTVRSWIPWVGQGIQFFKSPYTFFASSRSRYGSTFKFQLFGRYMVALSSPTAVSNFLRDRSGTFDVIEHQQTHRFCGINADEEHRALLYSILKKKLAPAALRCLSQRSLGDISPVLISCLQENVTKLAQTNPQSLQELVHRTIYETIAHTLFGPLLPIGTYSDFMEYDKGVTWIVNFLPAFVPNSVKARERLVAAYSRYLDFAWRDEKGGFLEGATEMMSQMYRELRSTELNHDEATRLMVHVLWAANSNIMTVTTWVMCHILTDKDTYKRVCNEIRGFVDVHFPGLEGLENMDFKTLDDGAFPFLSSIVQEVLRTKSSNVSMREAKKDVVIKDTDDVGILVRKGEYIVADMISMHNSEDLQSNPAQFQADRFLENPSYKSVVFGAGEHMCAGRHFANFLIRMFVVVTLSLYDMTVDGSPSAFDSMVAASKTSPLLMSFLRPREDFALHIRSRKVG